MIESFIGTKNRMYVINDDTENAKNQNNMYKSNHLPVEHNMSQNKRIISFNGPANLPKKFSLNVI